MAAYGLSLAQGISPQDQEPPGTVNNAGEIAAALKQPEGADKNYTSRIPPDSSVRERRPDGLVGVYTLNVQFGAEDTDGRLPSPAPVNVDASLTDKITAAIGGNRINKGGDACGPKRLSGLDGVEVPATRPLLPKAGVYVCVCRLYQSRISGHLSYYFFIHNMSPGLELDSIFFLF